jgi:serine phosphatase RsbU (regulator of sigma subunit)/catechol 2,3-dioxygenase-like lactoylglutathione lyase family enzyme
MASQVAVEPHLRIHGVNIYVRDQERSLRFYRDQLGFQVAFDARLQSGERWVAVAPPDGTAMLSLITPKPKSQEYKLIGRATQIILVTDDVAAKFREWSKRGVRFQTAPRLRRIKWHPQAAGAGQGPGRNDSPVLLGKEAPVWGAVLARFKDIDGNSFALISYDEVTHALEAQRRREAEKQEAERRAAQELEIAWRVQSRLFPQTLPRFQSLECAGACIPARKVGGDYYDVLDLGRDRYGFVVGDVVGKGIAAALMMANLQANLRSLCGMAFDQPRLLLRSVNRLFAESTADGSFATLFFAEYDDASGTLRYANCGHPPALLLRSDGTLEHLRSNAMVLGLFTEWDCAIEERCLLPGDVLALYTDGVTESFNDHGEEFGEARLIAALRRHAERSPQELLAAIVEEIRGFSPHEQHDDITLIVAKRGRI